MRDSPAGDRRRSTDDIIGTDREVEHGGRCASLHPVAAEGRHHGLCSGRVNCLAGPTVSDDRHLT